jgi:PAS domain S-box-containing protein
LFVAVVILLLPSITHAQQVTPPKRILLLYWNNRDYAGNIVFEQSFRAGLQSAPGTVEYYSEYLESNRFPGEKQSLLLRDYLRKKYADRHIDVILAVTDEPLAFLLKYRHELFTNIPIVFVAAQSPTATELATGPGITGIVYGGNQSNTLDLALRFHPGTEQVFIVSGTLEHDKRFEIPSRQDLEGYDSRVSITYLTDLPVGELIARTSSLPERSIILYLWQQSLDEKGNVLGSPDVLALIARSAQVPIYGLASPVLGSGIVGGNLRSPELMATRVAEIALQIANGAQAGNIPVAPPLLAPMFDWRQLKRWGIREEDLPPGSLVRFKEPTLWEEYKWGIVIFITFCFAQTLLIVGLFVQRSRRKRVERALAERELRLRESQAIAHVGSFHWDVVANTVAWSDELCRIYGFEPGESSIRYETYLDRVQPDHREQVRRAVERSLANRESFEHEYPILRASGETRWVFAHGQPVVDSSGNLIALQGVCQDITERKHVEQALRVSEEQARRTLVEQMLVGVAECDAAGKFVLVNQRFCDITGYTEAELLQLSRQDVTHPNDLVRVTELHRRLVEGGESFVTEIRYRRKDGSEVWVNSNVSPIQDARNEVVESVTVVIDVTDRKRAEREREQLLNQEKAARAESEAANRSKDEFLAVVSHELRNPLNAILGYTRLLRLGKVDATEIRRIAEILERNGRMQLQLIEDLLDTARIISGKLKLEVKAVSLSRVITAAIDVVRPAAQAKGIELRSDLEPLAGEITGDPDRLQQVVWNLLSNAIKFTPQSGRVEVRMDNAGHHARITIKDTGKGIEPEFLPFCFDRFRQADSSAARRFGGLGLGLSLVKKLVELHGGTIEAASDGLDRGATFTVTLPQHAAQADVFVPELPRGAPRAARMDDTMHFDGIPSLEGVRVLVVDDDIDSRTLLKSVLGKSGAQVMMASSGVEAIAILTDAQSTARPDALILDINMPEEDGYQALERVRALEAERGVAPSVRIPAIALTAMGRTEDRLKALAAGFRMHVVKPAEPGELIVGIASLVEEVRKRV